MSPEVEKALNRIAQGVKPSELESETLDFKQDARTPKETMRMLAGAATCFANALGGTIVVGVLDKATRSAAVVGTDLDPLAVKERIYALSNPPLLVDAAEHWREDAKLVVITVPSGVEIHADTEGRIKHRVGTSCLAMAPLEQQARFFERHSADYSAEVVSTTPGEINAAAMEPARERLRRSHDELFALADEPDAQLLRHLGVVNGQGRLLRAGELLFCDRGDDYPWVVYQYSPTPGGEATAVERLHGPLITVFDRLVELVWARRHTTPLTLPDAGQVEIADFPREAIREAVANALLHRELRIDRPVNVGHSPAGFVVESPGRLVPGITVHNILTHPSKPRNPCLFRAARRLRIVEDTGRGIDRIYRELIQSGRDAPSISQSADTTRVAFVGGAPRTRVARFLTQIDPQERDDVDTLLVIFTLLTSRTINEADLSPIIQKQPAEAGSVLARLAADSPGIIESTLESRTRRKPTYRLSARTLQALGSSVAYQRRSIQGADHKIIAHLRDYDSINNRTLQHLFDVDVHRASAMLRDLRDRGLIVKLSEQQRGPTVVYGPGPAFPG